MRSEGAELLAHQLPQKGVGSFKQQDGGRGSRNPPRSVWPSDRVGSRTLL